jgi:hypothetical protein
MELLYLIGWILLAMLSVVVLSVVGLLAYLSATMFRSAGRVDIKDDYLPPEMSAAQRKLDGAQLNLEILAELPGTEFVRPDAERAVDVARTEVADAARVSVVAPSRERHATELELVPACVLPSATGARASR